MLAMPLLIGQTLILTITGIRAELPLPPQTLPGILTELQFTVFLLGIVTGNKIFATVSTQRRSPDHDD